MNKHLMMFSMLIMSLICLPSITHTQEVEPSVTITTTNNNNNYNEPAGSSDQGCGCNNQGCGCSCSQSCCDKTKVNFEFNTLFTFGDTTEATISPCVNMQGQEIFGTPSTLEAGVLFENEDVELCIDCDTRIDVGYRIAFGNYDESTPPELINKSKVSCSCGNKVTLPEIETSAFDDNEIIIDTTPVLVFCCQPCGCCPTKNCCGCNRGCGCN